MARKRGVAWLADQKAEGAKELMQLKEEFLKLTPGFADDAKQFKKDLASATKKGDSARAHVLARSFAGRWNIPFSDQGNLTYGYLARSPFTRNPVIGEDLTPVQRMGNMALPYAELVIDLRWDAKLVENEVLRMLAEARHRLAASDKLAFSRTIRSSTVLANRKELYELAIVQGMTYRQYQEATRTAISADQFYRRKSEVRRLVENRGYEKILPFLNADQVVAIQAASAPYPFSKFRNAPLTAEVTAGDPSED